MILVFSPKKMLTMLIVSLVIFSVMTIRYLVGNVPGYVSLPDHLNITAPILLTAVVASLTGGWVISNAFSQHADIRETMASLLPFRLPLGWTAFAFLFFPALVLMSWA